MMTCLQSEMSSTSERLQQYRQRKQEEQQREARKELFWNTITLQSLRRRPVPQEEEVTRDKEGEQEVGEEEEEESEKKPWSKLDWAIISIKFLVWVCMQVSHASPSALSQFS